MNVKPGDLARLFETGTVNDGAVVRVLRRDLYAEQGRAEPHWLVQGEKLLGFRGDAPYPSVIADEMAAPDRCLRRIDPDEPVIDTREHLDLDLPITTENECLTT